MVAPICRYSLPGAFAFNSAFSTGAPYNVTVKSQPSGPTQTCTVANASGTVQAAGVTNITVTCATNSYSIGGAPIDVGNGSTQIVIDASGRYAYVANYGSNTISVFAIDGSSGVLTAISGSPFASQGTLSAISVTQNGFLYTASGTNSLAAYKLDSVSGALSPSPGSPFAVASAASVVIHPSGHFGYYLSAQAGVTVTENVSEYSLDAVTEAPTAISSPVAETQFVFARLPVFAN